MKTSPSHVAILVPSANKAADRLRSFGFEIGDLEDFEETREIYVQGGEQNSLLLMEPKESGSYRNALNKRGPGVHHLAIDVLDLEAFLNSISNSGWLLHLNSLKAMKSFRTAYLARPGFPALIEVQEKKKLGEGALFVENVSVKFDTLLANAQFAKLVSAVGLDAVVKASSAKPSLTLSGQSIDLETLF